MTDPVYLIDGSAYIYRAYHAITPLSTSDGLPTHAVYGFINTLLRVLRDKTPRYLAVAFDARGPNFRHEYYPAYKANRPAMPDDLAIQIPYIKQLVAAYNILALEMAGVEADDLIASAARALARAGRQVVLVSSDKDLYQLVSEAIICWEPMNDVVLDAAAVKHKYNVPPEQLLDLFALIGDKSDNVPGVPGVGPKTAEKLINAFGSLEKLYEALHGQTETSLKAGLREKLAGYEKEAFLAKRLIGLRDDLEIPVEPEAYRLPAADMARLKELYSRLEFSRLLKSEIVAEPLRHEGFSVIQTVAQLQGLLAELKAAPQMALDLETSGLDPLVADLAGVSICLTVDRSYYIPVGHKGCDDALCAGQLAQDQVIEALRPYLEDPRLPKIGHNLKFDYSMLLAHGIKLAGPLYDSMIASYLLNPSRRTHKLDDLCREVLDLHLSSFAEVTKGDKRENCFLYVPLPEAGQYSCADAYAALRLWEHFRPRLAALNLWELYTDIEMALVPILAHMELAGIKLDQAILKELSHEFSGRLAELESEIFRLAGETFNINSPRQLGEILFEKLSLPYGRKTKTGYSTDIKVLEKLGFHELPRAVILHRNLAKLKSTYVDKLAGLVHPQTGRVHTSFNQTITATGRLSSSNPNLQNIPIRTSEGQRLRQAFVPAAGQLFLAGDYSQIDLRVLAHYSQDPALLAAFRAGQDVHNQTAAEIFMVSPFLITPQMRRVAKTINFGIVYGMSDFGLASQLNISQHEAKVFIDRYFKHYDGVRQFKEKIIDQARADGFVCTLLNRRRYLPEINSANRLRREFAERTAINTPIQGTAADIIKLAMIRVDQQLRQAQLQARLLLQIHDELVLEVPAAEVAATKELVRSAMESVIELDVPMVVNLAVGHNLAEV